MEDRNIYQDIAERTQGDIYIGVVARITSLSWTAIPQSTRKAPSLRRK